MAKTELACLCMEPIQLDHFHPLEVVSRYRDPHLQVGEYDSH